MENEPKSTDDGDGVSQNEGKKRKADESQDEEIAKKLKGLFPEEFSESQLSMLSKFLLKQTTTSITLDGQGGSSEEKGAAAVSGKSDTNTTADDVAKKQATMSDSPGTRSEEREIERDDMKQVAVQKEAALKKGPDVAKKQATLRDSPGISPHRRAKMTASYMETTRSEESEIERDDMKQVAVQKEAALKKGSEVIEVERGGQGNDTSDIESGDEQGDSVIEIPGSHGSVVVYSSNVDLLNDEQHESIEQKGNCTVIADAVRMLKTQRRQSANGFEVLFGE
jgi:hypothetical protein